MAWTTWCGSEEMSKLLDRLQPTIDKFTENAGVPPHALVCNKKIYDAIAQELYADCRKEINIKDIGTFEKYRKTIPLEMRFKEIPIINNNDAPGDMIYAVDKETYEEITNIAKPTSSGDKA